MSHLQYYSYEGVGEKNLKNYWYNQAVRVGDRIEGAGQCGWDPKTGVFPEDTVAQIDQAFANVDLNLKNAGGKGWEQVFRVTSYHVAMDGEALGAMVRNLKQWSPNHQPIWTCVGVEKLAQDTARVEIDVVAHDP